MQRVNIPLSRHRKTTRPSRRVVFVSGWILVCIFVSAWLISDLWFQRITINSAAPEGTYALIEFQQTRGNTDLLHDILGNIPLISNRPVTYIDLAPYIAGEFGIFLHQDGYSVAYRQHKSIPEAILRSWGVEQTILDDESVVLLSEHLPAMTGIQTRVALSDRFPRIFSKRIGSIALIENETVLTSVLRSKRHALTTTVDIPPFFGESPKAISDSIGHLSTLPWPEIENFAPSWSHLLSSFLPNNIFSDEEVIVYLDQTDTESSREMISTLVILTERDQISSDIEQLLRVFGALSQPKHVPISLTDGTGMQELIADPSSISIETTSVLGLPAKRALLNNEMYLAAVLLPDGGMALTNSEDLLSHYMNDESERGGHCQKAPFSLSIDRFNRFLGLEQERYRPLLTTYLESHFSSFSMRGNKKTAISLCNR